MNPRNPFYLHPGENPRVTLVAPPLDDNNYHNWSKSMRRALTSKNKISFINGNLPKPTFSGPNYELWDRANSMVLSWINRTFHLTSHKTPFVSIWLSIFEKIFENASLKVITFDSLIFFAICIPFNKVIDLCLHISLISRSSRMN